ncbi:MAG TPA: hypothetical protein VLC98_14700 [Phnomibacter sp.]|nr:hypothetical protein [Phnomibacter sp.]
MITVAQYLSFMFSEITRARVIADTESLRIAEEYSKSPLMKYFSVPRFKIPELELSVPMVIAGAQYNNIYVFTWDKAEYDRIMANYVNRFSIMFTRPFKYDSKEMETVRNVVEDAYKDFATLPNVQDLKQLLEEKKLDAIQNIDQIVKSLLAVYNGQEKVKPGTLPFNRLVIIRTQTQEELVADWKRVVTQQLLENIRLKESVLKALLISPETNIVKTEGTDISILQIRAKITEEGIFVNSVKNENGDETKVVDFE